MLRETLSQTELLELPIFAFLVFLATFLFVVVRVLVRGKADAGYMALAALPLEPDDRPSGEEDPR